MSSKGKSQVIYELNSLPSFKFIFLLVVKVLKIPGWFCTLGNSLNLYFYLMFRVESAAWL